MTTIYTNSSTRTVTLDVPVEPVAGVEVTVTSVGNPEPLYRLDATVDSDGIRFILPFALTTSDRELEIEWLFTYEENSQTFEYNETTEVSVVTPILPLPEIKDILGESATDKQVAEVERAVRYVIQAHTGQFFGKYIGTYSITGSGEPYLRMPRRLMTLTSVNGVTHMNGELTIRGAGWFLQSRGYAVPTVRADFDGWHQDSWGYSGRVPIVAPYSKSVMNFIDNLEYEITGTWGWKSVPLAVQEAARLLINDYACADANYRDRFLTSMTAADWRLQYHEGAFSNTGNVRANQLLAKFVLRRGWVIV